MIAFERRAALFATLLAAIWSTSSVFLSAQDVGLQLGDLAAGGNGTGNASPAVVGINPDSGLLETEHLNGAIGIGDGAALTPVGEPVAPAIDSVFIIDTTEMPINSAGVVFSFPVEDVLSPPSTWDHILKDRIGGENTPVSLGGMAFEHGVGIHAAAGITFDLDFLRDLHGAPAVGGVTAFAGMGDSPDCLNNPGVVTTYMILSNDEEVLDVTSHRTSVGGEALSLAIPAAATYLTLAVGAGAGSFYCNAGTFGGALITGRACPTAGDTHCTGLSLNPPAGPPGSYTVTATATDDSGDPILYTFNATDGRETLTAGPQAANSTTFVLGAGMWTITARADDELACPDAAPDAACAEIQLNTCPPAGDTHCTDLDVDPAGGEPGVYTATAAAGDDSGDAVLYTFSADNGIDPPLVMGPQPEATADFFLNTGSWTISVIVDDDPGCLDAAPDASCAPVQVTVGPAPEGIDLGDVAAGGDGTGSADPAVVGIHPDSGLLEIAHINDAIGVVDGAALTQVSEETSVFIDSVFIIETQEMPINSAGVTFSFPPEDVLSPPLTWDHILKDRIGGEDTPLFLGGVRFEHGVGIHAAAGITYDLNELRDLHGAEAVGEVRAYAGMGDSPACLADPGTVTAYLILSDDSEIISMASHRTSVGGTPLALPIPPQAAFLTLATGAGNGSFNCNAGTFGGAVILGGSGTGVGPFLRGDCNQDGTNTGQVTDGVFLLNFLFLGGVSPRCLAACDFNGDGAVPGSPTDAVYYFNFNFLGGAAMPEPLRDCALSSAPGDVALGCADPAGCM